MLSAINAKIIYAGKKRINVEINSYYYWINVSEFNKFEVSSKPKKIFCKQISQIVNNEIKTEIYGFQTIKEIDWFQSLLSCQGIGPKTAMKIMKHNPDNIKNLIINKNINELSQCEGINSNIASSLIHHNWKSWELSLGDKQNNEKTKKIKLNESELEEIISTLVVLGYEKNDINKTLNEIELTENYDVSDIIALLIKTMADNQNDKQLSA
ncbi:Holliday junction branch migration protein RuvA [Mycoplasmoides pirum]|uniref:Holliday junction branch migration protein RuvA n=1 Tax=Mycoplasmoides pirum TaxID=2122 RepID=UPI00047F1933|nr:Holliday junction branch migration protein RuvA [Mycoplasmoides pirum]